MGEEDNKMYPPERTDLPFFAYGFFKPGELAYHQIEKYVNDDISPKEASAYGIFYEKDGVPILRTVPSSFKNNTVQGYIIHFRHGDANEAYQYICDMEPHTLY